VNDGATLTSAEPRALDATFGAALFAADLFADVFADLFTTSVFEVRLAVGFAGRLADFVGFFAMSGSPREEVVPCARTS